MPGSLPSPAQPPRSDAASGPLDRRRFLGLFGGGLLLAACSPRGGADGAAADTAAAPGGAPAAGAAAGAPGAGAFPLASVGVQLYTVRGPMGQDLERALADVAAAGYRLVETAGTAERTAADFRALLDRHGLSSPAGHWPLEALERDPDGQIAAARALGQQYVVVPWLAEPERGSLAAYRALAGRFNTIGRRVKDAGLQFAYHNHDFEFQTFGGSTPALDVLLQETDPELVQYELDIFWTYKAGHDPLAYFERFPGRFPLWHVKDATAAPERRMVDVGQGAIDWRALFAAGERAGLRYGFVEHDEPEDAMRTIRTSRQYLQTVLG